MVPELSENASSHAVMNETSIKGKMLSKTTVIRGQKKIKKFKEKEIRNKQTKKKDRKKERMTERTTHRRQKERKKES